MKQLIKIGIIVPQGMDLGQIMAAVEKGVEGYAFYDQTTGTHKTCELDVVEGMDRPTIALDYKQEVQIENDNGTNRG